MNQILERLAAAYPEARCSLEYGTVYQLLIAVILSAQCTDKRVNVVTNELFSKCPTAQEIANLSQDELESHIKSCGLYKNKAANIIKASKAIVEEFGGEVPLTMDELLRLPGVGRKTASVVLSETNSSPEIAVDTHVFRVSHRIGLSNGKNPYEVECDLKAIFTDKERRDAHHLLIYLGRNACQARNRQCESCPINDLCQRRADNV